MDKPHRVYVDDTHFITYPHLKSIKMIGAGIGVLKYPLHVAPPQLDYVGYVGVARHGRIGGRELDVLGMMIADKLVELSRPKDSSAPMSKYKIANMYHFCGGIGSYVEPYLENHSWRREPKNDRNTRRIISKRIDEPVDRNTPIKLNYRRKQTIGKMATADILENVKIPKHILTFLVWDEDSMLDIRSMSLVKSESSPPPGYVEKRPAPQPISNPTPSY